VPESVVTPRALHSARNSCQSIKQTSSLLPNRPLTAQPSEFDSRQSVIPAKREGNPYSQANSAVQSQRKSTQIQRSVSYSHLAKKVSRNEGNPKHQKSSASLHSLCSFKARPFVEKHAFLVKKSVKILTVPDSFALKTDQRA